MPNTRVHATDSEDTSSDADCHRESCLDEPIFADLTALAAVGCGVPMTFLSYGGDDRPSILSVHGIQVEQARRLAAIVARRNMSGRTIVMDVAPYSTIRCDEEFDCGQRAIRFIAATPLSANDGVMLGMLCVLDTVPRGLSSTQSEVLSKLGRQAHALLQMQQRYRCLQKELAASVAARQKSDSANHSKSDFLAHMSHEIRTPLNGIIGMTEIALDSNLTVDQRELLETVKTSSDSLLQIVNKTLDLAKIEAGQFDLEPQPFRVRATISEILKPHSIQAHQKQLELICDISPSVQETVIGDAGRLRQVLVNLIGNAIKFTSRGSVTLSVATESVDQSTTRLHFSVSDTGIGIPIEKQTVIFDAFTQASASTARIHGGTGLGLSISRQIVQMMGGMLSVESQPGNGSTFRFAIDLPVVPNAVDISDNESLTADSSSRQQPRGSFHRVDQQASHRWKVAPWNFRKPLRVLLAEDNLINQRIAVRMLNQLGHAVEVAQNGQLALDAWKRTTFDVVLLDIEMPVLNGVFVVQSIREWEASSSKRTPLVAFSALGGAVDRAQLNAIGFDAYVSKPIVFHELTEVLHRVVSDKYLERRTNNEGNELQSAPSKTEPPCDLIAAIKRFNGDTEFARELVELYLGGIVDLLASLELAVSIRDVEAAGEISHAIKGSFVSLCAKRSYDAAQRLESICRHGCRELLETTYNDFVREVGSLNQYLHSGGAWDGSHPIARSSSH